MEEVKDQNRQTIIIQREPAPTNGLGVAGFVLSLIALFLGWIPVLGWVVWFLGLIFSFCGLFKSPRGLAVAGFIISLLDFIMLLFVFGALAAIFMTV